MCARPQLRGTQRLKSGDGVRRLEKGVLAITREPRVRLERTSCVAPNADDDARVVPRAPEQEREHRGTAKAAVAPDPPAAVENSIDMEREQLRTHGLATRGHAREPCERASCRKELERARHCCARSHDLELR